MHTLHKYKAEAGRIAECARKGNTFLAAHSITHMRLTYGGRAALMGALVIGALVESGHADEAERLTIELARNAGVHVKE